MVSSRAWAPRHHCEASPRLCAVTTSTSELLLLSRRNPRSCLAAGPAVIRSTESGRDSWFRSGTAVLPTALSRFPREKQLPCQCGWHGRKVSLPEPPPAPTSSLPCDWLSGLSPAPPSSPSCATPA